MAAVRHRNSHAELLLRSELWRRGLRYRLHHSLLAGRPDLVFGRARVVVFVDGDFWHGRGLIQDGDVAFLATLRTKRREWWLKKLRRNIERDAEVTRRLREQGWRVLRYWESDVKRDVVYVADLVGNIVKKARRSS